MPFDLGAFRRSVLTDPLVYDIWDQKYRLKKPDGSSDEATVDDTRRRVVEAVYAQDPSQEEKGRALRMVLDGYLVPAGRVNAGAGTGRNVTLGNCYVLGTVMDSLPGIQRTISEAAFTMQQGGGVGVDYSTIRPHGALVGRTCSVSSGVIPFADQQSAMCETIVSAGTRRGAMMLVLRDDHPDLWNPEQFETMTDYSGRQVLRQPSFISVKRQKGRLTQFNVSVLVSAAFMRAVEEDAEWDLGFHVPRADGNHVAVVIKPFPYDYYDMDNDGSVSELPSIVAGTMRPWYVYRRVPARRIWDDIMRSTYTYAEPGVIFIDRVNERNNLSYCETISATNPCFAADTFVVTNRGAEPIKDLVGRCVSVFDGQQWRIVDNFRITGENQPMLRVELHDGSRMRITPAHKMILENGSRVEAQYLKEGDRLRLHTQEYDGEIEEAGAYIKGFLTGDGTLHSNGQPALYLYPPKYECAHRLVSSASEMPVGDVRTSAKTGLGWLQQDTGRQTRLYLSGLTPRQDGLLPWCCAYKNGLPCETFRWNRASKCEFLAGLFDADGTVVNGSNGYSYQLSSISENMLRDVQALLKSIGVYSTLGQMKRGGRKEFPGGVYDTKPSWRLSIGQTSAIRLSQQVHFSRLSSFANKTSTYAMKPKRGIVKSVEYDGVDDLVYCCTVSVTHSVSLACGVVTGQCGEQPLPPYGMCDLASLNLAFMVDAPFTPNARLNTDLLMEAAGVGIRFLDNVLDVTNYPLAQQRGEAMAKRRIGLGVTGWGDALLQLGVPYGSPLSVEMSGNVARTLQRASYAASAELAKERGAFQRFDRDAILNSFNVRDLPESIREAIAKHGLRNGVINTVAPNGTISIYSGNVSSGIEPVFSFDKVARKVRQADGSLREYESVDYAYRLYEAIYGPTPVENLPSQFVSAMGISATEHVTVLAAWQQHIDASISKTVNCAPDMSFDDFQDVYRQAYKMGCKGCTTYRPDPTSGRGSVLSVVETKPENTAPVPIRSRPRRLDGATYKIKWPLTGTNWYITVTRDTDGVPLELFITTRDVQHLEWVQALSCMVTAILRRRGDVQFLVQELKQVSAATGFAFLQVSDAEDHPVQYPSVVAAIGGVLEAEWKRLSTDDGDASPTQKLVLTATAGTECPKCGEFSLIRENGCKRCLSCGYEQCG